MEFLKQKERRRLGLFFSWLLPRRRRLRAINSDDVLTARRDGSDGVVCRRARAKISPQSYKWRLFTAFETAKCPWSVRHKAPYRHEHNILDEDFSHTQHTSHTNKTKSIKDGFSKTHYLFLCNRWSVIGRICWRCHVTRRLSQCSSRPKPASFISAQGRTMVYYDRGFLEATDNCRCNCILNS